MKRSTSHLEFTSGASVDVVCVTLLDVEHFADWLPRSPVYFGTKKSASGAGYVDVTALGRVHGAVEVSESASTSLTFLQATRNRALDVRITYRLSPTTSGCQVSRTGDITTRGALSIIHPVVLAFIRAENRRTMAHMERHLARPR